MPPTYRLLIIALKRGVLKGYTSIEASLVGEGYYIQFKLNCMQDAVFYQPGPKCLTVQKKVISAARFGCYLQRVAKKYGYGFNGTTYAWRRKVATEVQRTAGTERIQKFLAHNGDGTYHIRRCKMER